jgi:hypothetical protein
MSNEEVQDRHGWRFFLGGEGIRRVRKRGLVRDCNDQGSRFISTQGRLAFDSPTVLMNALIGNDRVTSDNPTYHELGVTWPFGSASGGNLAIRFESAEDFDSPSCLTISSSDDALLRSPSLR